MNRKLKFKELMLISKIFKDLNVKSYVEYLLGNKLEKLLKSNDTIETKQMIVITDIIAFIVQNMAEAETNIYKLFSSYSDIEDIENMEADMVYDSLFNIFKGGIPSVIKDMIDLDDLKKKMSDLTEN